MSGVLDRRDFMRGSASMLTAGMALYSRDSDMSKGEEPQNRDSLPYKVKFYEFSEYEISDTCWALSMGPDGRIYAAACAENVPGGLVTQGRKPKTANLEVGVLLRLLKRAKLRDRKSVV